MSKAVAVNAWHYDVRVQRRYVRWGAISAGDAAKHLAALPDLSAQCEPTVTEQPMFEGEPELDDEVVDTTPVPTAVAAAPAASAPAEVVPEHNGHSFASES